MSRSLLLYSGGKEESLPGLWTVSSYGEPPVPRIRGSVISRFFYIVRGEP